MILNKYNVLAPVLHAGAILTTGEIELSEPHGKRLVESGVLEQVEAVNKPIEDMTVPELKDYAKQKEIDLGDATKKDDIVGIIKKAEELQV